MLRIFWARLLKRVFDIDMERCPRCHQLPTTHIYSFDVDVQSIVYAKTYPENREFLSIYYHCNVLGGEEKAGEKFVQIKWIKPKDIKQYFSTSLHTSVYKYLKELS